MKPVAVLGGGWAGMAAAVELAAAGIPATVFEAARTLGGRARRVEVNGLALDNGAHILVGAYRETLRLIRLVSGATTGLRMQPLDLHVHGRFRLRAPALPAPLHLAAGLLGAQGVGWGERIAAARFMSRMRQAGFRIDPDTTVSELLSRHRQGPNLSRYLWEALCLAALNTPADQASARVFLNVLRDSLSGSQTDSRMLLPSRDLSALFPDPAARYIESQEGSIVTGCAVHGVLAVEGGYEVAWQPGSERFEQVICALPPYRVPDVLAPVQAVHAVLPAIRALRYEPIYTVYLQCAPQAMLPQAMLGFDSGLAQWAFDRGRLCGQPGLIAAVISASGPHEALEHDALAARVHAELASELPAFAAAPRWSKVIAERRATFACTPHLARPAQVTPAPGLYLAGDYTDSPYPGTLEAAVRSGIECARLVLAARRRPSEVRPATVQA